MLLSTLNVVSEVVRECWRINRRPRTRRGTPTSAASTLNFLAVNDSLFGNVTFFEGGEIPGFNSISGRAGAEVRRLMFVRVGGGTGRALIRWCKVKMAKIPARYGHERTLGFLFFFVGAVCGARSGGSSGIF